MESTTNAVILWSGETPVVANQIGTFGIPRHASSQPFYLYLGVLVVSHLTHLRGTIQVLLITYI